MIYKVNCYPRLQCPKCGHCVRPIDAGREYVPGERILAFCDPDEGGCDLPFIIRTGFQPVHQLFSQVKEQAIAMPSK